MRIRSQTMLAGSHSWAVTMRALLSEFAGMGHNLILESTNGHDQSSLSLLPEALNRNQTADLDICYTVPPNFATRLRRDSQVKTAIYNYESSVLPSSWAQMIGHVDYVFPSSEYSRRILINSGWPESKCVTVHHGVDAQHFINNEKYALVNKNTRFRFLCVAVPHFRKNIDLLLSAYYSEFTNEDDVCLVLKSKVFPGDYTKKSYEVDIRKIFIEAQSKQPAGRREKLPPVEVVQGHIENMGALYRSCNAVVSASSGEGFGLPLLEGLAARKIVIAPGCTGQLDFLSSNNSLLVEVEEVKAPPQYQYWHYAAEATTFMPQVDSLAAQMRAAYDKEAALLRQFSNEIDRAVKRFSWRNAAEKIMAVVN